MKVSFASCRRYGAGLLGTLALAACQPSAERSADLAAQAQQRFDAGQPREALTLVNAAVAERDDIPAVLLLQGRIAMAIDDRALAYRAYSNALALEASNPEALDAVAQLGLSTGHLREAEDAADKLLILQPEHVGALTTKALIAIVHSDLATAGGLADRILRRQPGDLGGLILKSRVQALDGDRAGALATLRTGEGRYAGAPVFVTALVELLRAQGDGPGLLAQLQRLKAIAPDQYNYRLDLADVLYRLGRAPEARAEIAALIAEPVKDSATIEGIVRLWQAGDGNTVLSPAELDTASRGASVEARLAIARHFLSTGQPALAAAVLRPVATGWNSDVQGVYALVQATQRDPGAGAAIAALLAKDPGNGGALLARIRLATAEGRIRDAVTDAQRVAADYPQWDEGYLALAQAYAGLRDRVGVGRAFEQGIRARPQSLPLARTYAAWLLGDGNGQRALEVARRFALDSPSLPAAWRLYGTVCTRTRADDCAGEAAEGAARARTRFGLDPVPGTPAPIAAVGRLS